MESMLIPCTTKDSITARWSQGKKDQYHAAMLVTSTIEGTVAVQLDGERLVVHLVHVPPNSIPR
ncbi:MAG: hypothetical protein OXG05_01115 [Gammaproteobacteria bacterium]|nr:hypothetical protein [Gammaproteobacteria bacterium]